MTIVVVVLVGAATELVGCSGDDPTSELSAQVIQGTAMALISPAIAVAVAVAAAASVFNAS